MRCNPLWLEQNCFPSETTFHNASSWMQNYGNLIEIALEFLERVQRTMRQHWFRQCLNTDQAMKLA